MAGRARIKGTRIRVMDLVGLAQANDYTAEQLADDFSHVPRAAIFAAFAYYYDNLEEIEEAFAESERFAEEFKRQNPDIVHELVQ